MHRHERIAKIMRSLPLVPGAEAVIVNHADYIATFYDLHAIAGRARPQRAGIKSERPARLKGPLERDALERAVDLATAIRDMRRALANAGLELEMALRHELGDSGLVDLRRYLKAIEPRIFAAHDRIEQAPPAPLPKGRRPNVLAAAITDLAAESFETLTGIRATVGTDWDSKVKYGSFLSFLKDIFEALGVVAAPVAQINAMIKRRDIDGIEPQKIGASFTF